MDLVISHVYKDFGRGPVLRDVSLTVRQGETVCLMGPSGLGKTTLLRCVAGLERPESGSITGVPERLGYVFQEDRLCGVFSAVANVRLATGRALPEAEILRHLEELGLAGSARRPVSQLSGGMRRRVAIARALAMGPKVLICDEATSALDVTVQKEILDLLRGLEGDLAILFICHDISLVQQFCHRVLVMHRGEIVEQGTPDEVICRPQHAYTRHLIDSVL